jgi:hypothetical protein
MKADLLKLRYYDANAKYAPTSEGQDVAFIILNDTAAAITPTVTIKGAQALASDACAHDPATVYDVKIVAGSCGANATATVFSATLTSPIPAGGSAIVMFQMEGGVPPFLRIDTTTGKGILSVGTLHRTL